MRFVSIGLLVMMSGGCSTYIKTERREPGSPRSAHLIFNPSPDTTPAVAERADWPETFLADRLSEYATYEEVIHDWQGLSRGDWNDYRRRVYSVRTGATRR